MPKSKGGSFKSKLASWSKKYTKASEKAKDEGGAFQELDDGTYIMRLTGAEVRLSQNDNLGVSLEFTVVKGESKGAKHFMWLGLSDDEKALKRLAKTMQALGVDDMDLDELEDTLKKMLKDRLAARVRLRTSPATDEYSERQWTNVLKVVELDDDDDDDDDKKDDDDDDDDDDKKDKKKGKDDDDDDDDEGGEGDYTPSKGDIVVFNDDDDDEQVGKITSCPPGAKGVVVTTADGEDHKVKVKDLVGEASKKQVKQYEAGAEEAADNDDDDDDKKKSKKDDDDEAQEPEKGMSCVFKKNGKGKEIEGKIVKVNKDDEEVVVKTEDGDKFTLAFDAIEILVDADDDDGDE